MTERVFVLIVVARSVMLRIVVVVVFVMIEFEIVKMMHYRWWW